MPKLLRHRWYVINAWDYYYEQPNRFVARLHDAAWLNRREAEKVVRLFSSPSYPLRAENLHERVTEFRPPCPSCGHALRRHAARPDPSCADDCWECVTGQTSPRNSDA